MPASESSDASALGDALVWIDCEMTGLSPDTEEILEIYCVLTTASLDIIDPEGFHAVVHWPADRLDQMDEWCTITHGKSGLTAAVLASDTTPAQAAEGLYRYITRFIPKPRTALLAGNSVHADRAFLRKEPYGRVVEHLHYRILDVSAIKEAARRWSPPQLLSQAPPKKGSHKARDDILESIEEARFYKEAIFGASGGTRR
ncbi:hypothetical protein Trco_005592 [Trichoderma cornu-damae]|uniref:Exonuclease domain-containing protein n=1 Tax=Trichoderma cornu-damae TaxID=654480 RepID=A0A9P8TVD1_9HYPO|nr:hypothetical protein Trco_005592 [Trichoderma cornu-damae]